MASFKVKLFIDDQERNVLNVDQAFKQVADITGRPSGKPYGEPLYITLESTIDDSFFYINTFSPSNTISGELVFYKRDGFSILYKLQFANAYILGLEEAFEAVSSLPLHFNLKIGWGIIKVNGVTFEEKWNPDNPFEDTTEATVIEEGEPNIISLKYVDAEGNEIEELYEDEVFLEIRSENCVGKLVDIDLSDDEFDFSYEGEHLANDLLEDLEITADLQKIKLTVFEEEEPAQTEEAEVASA